MQKPVLVEYEVEYDYTLMNEVMVLIKKFNCMIVKKEMQLFCRMIIGVPKTEEEQCLQQLKELHRIAVTKKNQ